MTRPLPEQLIAEIAAGGPLRLDAFMARCLGTYYAKSDPFGTAGDFTTAPEISQMFGELCGLWLAQAWLDAGAPDPFVLVEPGPGRGTLMADALRAARGAPGFVEAARLHLVETSPALRAVQATRLADHAPVWLDTIEAAPPGPLFLVANEFFDALPIRQFHRTTEGWRERMVGIEDGALAFGLSPPLNDPSQAPTGSVREVCASGEAIAAHIGARLQAAGGAALIIDYGHLAPAFGDTLQALRGHAFADPLADPGEADLTAHVDFAALARAAGGAAFATTQGDFLRALGIGQRASALAQRNPGAAETIALARDRLIDPDQMGTLFKVMALMPEGAPPPPGFQKDHA